HRKFQMAVRTCAPYWIALTIQSQAHVMIGSIRPQTNFTTATVVFHRRFQMARMTVAMALKMAPHTVAATWKSAEMMDHAVLTMSTARPKVALINGAKKLKMALMMFQTNVTPATMPSQTAFAPFPIAERTGQMTFQRLTKKLANGPANQAPIALKKPQMTFQVLTKKSANGPANQLPMAFRAPQMTFQVPIQKLRNQANLTQRMTKAATSATMAMMIRPIGENRNDALSAIQAAWTALTMAMTFVTAAKISRKAATAWTTVMMVFCVAGDRLENHVASLDTTSTVWRSAGRSAVPIWIEAVSSWPFICSILPAVLSSRAAATSAAEVLFSAVARSLKPCAPSPAMTAAARIASDPN